MALAPHPWIPGWRAAATTLQWPRGTNGRSFGSGSRSVTGAVSSIGPSGRAFASLRIPSFRWWFLTQILSGSGAMAQAVGQAWLVLELTNSGLALGLLSAATFSGSTR